MNLNDLPMDSQWLPFTPNRHFRKDPRVFVAADGWTLVIRGLLDGLRLAGP